MKKHLGNPLNTLSSFYSAQCAKRNPYMKGRMLGLTAFHQAYIDDPTQCCKKCAIVYKQYLNNL